MVLICSLTLSMIAIPTVGSAQTTDEKIEQKDKEISSLKAKQSELSDQISSLEAEIATIYDKGVALNQKKIDLQEESDKLKKEITTLDKRIEKRTDAIQKQGRDVQVNGQGTKMLEIILNSDSISDAISRVQGISSILSANNKLIEQQKEDKQAVEDKKQGIQDNLVAMEEAAAELDQEKESLVGKQADLNVLKAQADTDTSNAESSKNSLVKEQQEALKAQLEQEAAAKKAEEQKAATQKAEAQKTTETAVASSETPATSQTTSTQPSVETPSETPAQTPTDTPKAGGGGGSQVTPPVVSDSSDATLNALNALRQSHGLNPVSWDAGLAANATSRAAGMQGFNIPSDHWSRGDEVIAFMWAPGNSVIMAWYNETNMQTSTGTGHRDWELNPNMTRVGFGYVGDVIVGHSA